MSLKPGTVIDRRYRIVRLIGAGAMGDVYEAVHERIHRRCALKVMRGNSSEDPDAARRFEREAKAASEIGSEHIAQVFDFGELRSGRRFIVMEYLEGQSLRDFLDAQGTLDPQEALLVAEQLLEALEAAHAAGVIHRDIKPDNVFLVEDGSGIGFVKLLDFGVAKLKLSISATDLTQSGAVVGTPHYLSPEQAQALPDIDRRADLFSLGVVMFETLTGKRPFSASSASQLLLAIVLDDAPRVDALRPDLDPRVADIVARALARKRNQRYQSAGQMLADVRAWLDAVDAPRPPVEAHDREPAARDAPTADTAVPTLVQTPLDAAGPVSGDATMAEPSHVGGARPSRRQLTWLALGALLVAGVGGALLARARPVVPDEAPADPSDRTASSQAIEAPHLDVPGPSAAPSTEPRASANPLAPSASLNAPSPAVTVPPRLRVPGDPPRPYRKKL